MPFEVEEKTRITRLVSQVSNGPVEFSIEKGVICKRKPEGGLSCVLFSSNIDISEVKNIFFNNYSCILSSPNENERLICKN